MYFEDLFSGTVLLNLRHPNVPILKHMSRIVNIFMCDRRMVVYNPEFLFKNRFNGNVAILKRIGCVEKIK